jgi:hypothetical protein
MDLTAAEISERWPCDGGEYQLMIILAGQSEEALLKECEVLLGLCGEAGSREPMLAEGRREQDLILRIRSELYPVLKRNMYDALDVTLPRHIWQASSMSSIGSWRGMVSNFRR